MRNLLLPLLYICVGALLSMMLMRSCQPKEIITEIQRTDTLVVQRVDTIVKIQPQPYSVVIKDTITLRDTILVGGQTLFQEIKEYKDSTYYARISGINAFLEEIRVYPRTTTQYITTTERVYQKPKKWGLGVIGGYGIGSNGLQPYIGVGISYDVVQW